MGEKESHAMRVCAKCEMSISNSVAKGVWNIHLTLTKFHKYNVFFFKFIIAPTENMLTNFNVALTMMCVLPCNRGSL